MLDSLQYYFRVLCNGMKMRFRMIMIAHPGRGIGFHKRFMWRIIIPPTTDLCIYFWNLNGIFQILDFLATDRKLPKENKLKKSNQKPNFQSKKKLFAK